MSNTAIEGEHYIQKYHNDAMFHRITEMMGNWLFLHTLTEDDLTWAAKLAIEMYRREVRQTVLTLGEMQARWDKKSAIEENK